MTITPYLTTVHHARTSPLRNIFSYRSCAWLIELTDRQTGDAHDVPFPGRRRKVALRWGPFVRFEARDHLGDPRRPWRDNVIAFAAQHGIDLAGARITVLTGGRCLGYAFDPLTVYWCQPPAGQDLVIAEVRNTYRQRHCYLLRPDQRGRVSVEKTFYVSPFNDVDGYYTMSLPRVGPRVDITVTLHRPGQRPFVATWRGHRPARWADRTRFALRAPISSYLTTALIYSQGLRLWARRLPIHPRHNTAPEPATSSTPAAEHGHGPGPAR